MPKSDIAKSMPVDIEEFMGSPFVQAMRSEQKWWYMSLLLNAWRSSNPCHLPNDPSRLWALAGAPSPKAWKEHGGLVQDRFDVTSDGLWIFNRKQLEVFDRQMAKYQSYKLRGKKGADSLHGKIAELKPSYNSAITQPSIAPFNCSSEVAVVVGSEVKTLSMEKEFDGEAAFLELCGIYPRPQDDYLTRQTFMERVLKDAPKAGSEEQAYARIRQAAERYASMVDRMEIITVHNLRTWLLEGIYKQDPAIWVDASVIRERAKKSQLQEGMRR